VKLNLGGRYGFGAVALAVTTAVLLSACSSDKKTDAGASSDTAAASSSSAAIACPSGTLKGEGSTAQKNAMDQWTKDFQTKCSGSTITYNGTGSGAGVQQFTGKQVDFAGSDSALNTTKGEDTAAATACGSPAADLPMVVGPIAVAFNVKGVEDSKLVLTPHLIAQMFLGGITKWNDPAIVAENKGLTLPDTAITVLFRSDESGTTENFEKYLKAAAPSDFTADTGKAWAGKVGQGKAKSQGVQQAISSTDGGLGYVEWSFAVSGNLSTAKVDNGGGAVALDADTASKAAAAATIVGTGADVSLKLDYATKVSGAYPIVLVTYEIVCTKYASAATGAFVKAFLTYTAGDGQKSLPDLGYAPIPASVKSKVDATIAAIS
jgi:phosphate transport system substrate-binding protein